LSNRISPYQFLTIPFLRSLLGGPCRSDARDGGRSARRGSGAGRGLVRHHAPWRGRSGRGITCGLPLTTMDGFLAWQSDAGHRRPAADRRHVDPRALPIRIGPELPATTRPPPPHRTL